MVNDDPNLHCVKCGQPSLFRQGAKSYCCNLCVFVYFHNVAVAVFAVIVCNDQILLVERAQQPAKGKLDFPGGFADYNESNEEALTRELMEELQMSIDNMQYLFSYPNRYLFKDVLYSTLDSIFESRFDNKPSLVLKQEVISRYF